MKTVMHIDLKGRLNSSTIRIVRCFILWGVDQLMNNVIWSKKDFASCGVAIGQTVESRMG